MGFIPSGSAQPEETFDSRVVVQQRIGRQSGTHGRYLPPVAHPRTPRAVRSSPPRSSGVPANSKLCCGRPSALPGRTQGTSKEPQPAERLQQSPGDSAGSLMSMPRAPRRCWPATTLGFPVAALTVAVAPGGGAAINLEPRAGAVWFPPRLAAAPRARPSPVRRAAGAGRGYGADAAGGEVDPGRPQPDTAAGRGHLRAADGRGDGGEAGGEGRGRRLAAHERSSGAGGGAVPRGCRDPRPGGVDSAGVGVGGWFRVQN